MSIVVATPGLAERECKGSHGHRPRNSRSGGALVLTDWGVRWRLSKIVTSLHAVVAQFVAPIVITCGFGVIKSPIGEKYGQMKYSRRCPMKNYDGSVLYARHGTVIVNHGDRSRNVLCSDAKITIKHSSTSLWSDAGQDLDPTFVSAVIFHCA